MSNVEKEREKSEGHDLEVRKHVIANRATKQREKNEEKWQKKTSPKTKTYLIRAG